MSQSAKDPTTAESTDTTPFEQFVGGTQYIADDGLLADVNAAIALGRPLLVRGEPGTGKTRLAYAIAEALKKPL